MALERIYTIPLRKALRARKVKRANKAMTVIKEFAIRHMKAETVVLHSSINEKVWENSRMNIPRKIKVRINKDDEGKATVYLLGMIEKPKKKDKIPRGKKKAETTKAPEKKAEAPKVEEKKKELEVLEEKKPKPEKTPKVPEKKGLKKTEKVPKGKKLSKPAKKKEDK